MKSWIAFATALAAAALYGQGAHGPEKGWLFLEGGSSPVDPAVAQAFVKLAGGPDKNLVLIPTAADEDRIESSKLEEYAKPFGTRNFTILHTRDHHQANSPEFVKPLRMADAVWMSGGKPQNLHEAYNGTLVLKELRALLDRGGVLGGSSAGAMIQPSIMAVGVKRRGTGPVYLPAFGFLKDSVAFVHVEQRHVDEDLLETAKAQPNLLVVGIDTATAIAVQGDRFEVVGRRRVQVVRNQRVITLAPGDRFHMRTMTAVSANVHVSRDRPGLFHGELWAAADPNDSNRLIAASMAYDAATAKDRSVAYVSQDGGRNWKLTLETGESVDPACAYGPRGELYFLHLSRTGRGMRIFRSMDGGSSWSAPTEAPYLDRPYIAIDGRGGLYINAHEPGESDPRTRLFCLMRSFDGKTFGATVKPEGTPALAVTPGNGVFLADGTFAAVFTNAASAAGTPRKGWIGVVTAADNGKRLRAPGRVADWHSTAGASHLSSLPQLAVDASRGRYQDRLYAVWPDARSGRSQIYVSWSSDRGATWSAPQVIDEDVARADGAGPDHLQPAVAVNRNGVVGVSWYDRRDSADNRGWRARFSASMDGGVTFSPGIAVSEAAYDPAKTRRASVNEVIEKIARNTGAVSHRPRWNFAFTGGDTAGIAADGAGAFHLFWTDNRTGVPQVWTSSCRTGN